MENTTGGMDGETLTTNHLSLWQKMNSIKVVAFLLIFFSSCLFLFMRRISGGEFIAAITIGQLILTGGREIARRSIQNSECR